MPRSERLIGRAGKPVVRRTGPIVPVDSNSTRTESFGAIRSDPEAHRVWKITKALGARAGVPELHPHAFRHSCGVELLRRSKGNLRAVQEHLRHADIQTTTIYTRLTQSDLQKVISEFDKNNGDGNRDSRPSPHST